MNNIKGLIFDYGGTIDTAGCHWGKMLFHAYGRQGVAVTEEQFRQAYVYAERFLGAQPVIAPHDTFRKTLDEKLRLELDYLQTQGYLNAGAFLAAHHQAALLDDLYQRVQAITSRSREVLEQLSRRYPLVLVTNFYGNMGVVLQEFGLDHLFRQVVESAVVGVRKPDAAIFRLGVHALGLAPDEVLVVGDSMKNDIRPAQSVGCRAVWLRGEGWTADEQNGTVDVETISDLSELLTDSRFFAHTTIKESYSPL